MGSLVITRVRYSGNKYFYDSPVLTPGINIIVGDNGSGKSTFTYFIEYAFGGKVKPFIGDDGGGRYSLILEDSNNYVLVDFSINGVGYSIKRFIDTQEIFVDEASGTRALAVSRQSAPYIFSDWLLEKLNIPVFELNMGATHWYFNFTDLFRLLNYDQNTETRKIFKAPVAENFVADSTVIRKSIFEILLGMSSAEYFKKLDEAKAALKKRDDAKALLDNFIAHNDIDYVDNDVLGNKKQDLERLLENLESERNSYLKRNSTVDDKIGELSEIQENLLNLELEASQDRIDIVNLSSERSRVVRLHDGLLQEISQIEKIIFTHDKLDLFSMEICPFCMTDKKHIEKGFCICGSKFQDDDYEKFVYDSSEYKDILSHKKKSISAITLAKETYDEDIDKLDKKIAKNTELITEFTARLKNVISTAEFAGNSTVVDELNDRIIHIREELFDVVNSLKVSAIEQRLRDDYFEKNKIFSFAQGSFNKAKIEFENNNRDTITAFNEVYSQLLAASSYKSKKAEIDEDYMPFIDEGEYKANSSEVPKRLMYYFTILSLSLKLDSVKHPRFLLIDTPEDSGIDTDHLNQNLELLDMAIGLAKDERGLVKDYQVILTTGYGRLPAQYEKYVVEKFMEKEGNFILKPKTQDIS